MTKFDITSTAVEKGLDIAKDFLDKLIMPSVEETGLLLRDRVTLWRLTNQVKMLNKTREICERNNISPKAISLKLICPLLDGAGLEEDEEMQDKWAILLSNLVDSVQNIQNHVFPYLLSQISIVEYNLLEAGFIAKQQRKVRLEKEVEDFTEKNKDALQEGMEKNQKIKEQLSMIEDKTSEEYKLLEQFYLQSFWSMRNLHLSPDYVEKKMAVPVILNIEKIAGHEVSNLVRLGLIKIVQDVDAKPKILTGQNVTLEFTINQTLNFDFIIKETYVLSELGELFLAACTEKRNQ